MICNISPVVLADMLKKRRFTHLSGTGDQQDGVQRQKLPIFLFKSRVATIVLC